MEIDGRVGKFFLLCLLCYVLLEWAHKTVGKHFNWQPVQVNILKYACTDCAVEEICRHNIQHDSGKSIKWPS